MLSKKDKILKYKAMLKNRKLTIKQSFFLVSAAVFFLVLPNSCNSTEKALNISEGEKAVFNEKSSDTLTIKNDSVEYEITIIELGFVTWLKSVAKPPGYYSQSYLENRNQIYVTTWNQRVLEPTRFDPNLYELQINYNPQIDYGYDVNYQLYNYFIYFQRKYNQRLGPFAPNI